MTQTALILGPSGKIGRHFKTAFQAAGWQTRDFRRGTDMVQAARGCDVIVNGLNPPAYHDWARQLPAITEQVIAAARASGARVLFPGNVYVFGLQPGPWDQDTPHRPTTRKGAIRAQVEAMYRDSGVKVLILRAGEFMDADSGSSALDVIYLRNLKAGRITSPGDPAVRRAHAWLPDLARAGVALLARPDLPVFLDVPFPGHTLSAQDILDGVQRLTGQNLRMTGFPWRLMRLTAPVWELARELQEMRPLFSHPHSLSGERLAALLPGFTPTPLDEALRAALDRRKPAQAA